MLNTRDLERRWLKYKIKSFLPYVFIVLTLLVVGISIFVYISQTNRDSSASLNKVQTEVVEENKSDIIVSSTKKQEIKEEDLPLISNVVQTNLGPLEPSQQEKKVVLKPSMDFIKKIQESSGGYYRNTPEEETFNTPYATQTPKPKKALKQTIAVEDVEVEEKAVSKVDETKKVIIAKKTSLQDIKDAEKRFKLYNSPALSLFLAKQYYALEDYSKSYNYALITNQLDKTNEDSWLIFSRSLVKLGKSDLAKKALREYINYSHSNNAELLLNDIMTGKFQ